MSDIHAAEEGIDGVPAPRSSGWRFSGAGDEQQLRGVMQRPREADLGA
ncbi:hypothetical protein ACWCPF_44645 [Streptomyces sp. NPDC001858]